jgi:hypothetical protein
MCLKGFIAKRTGAGLLELYAQVALTAVLFLSCLVMLHNIWMQCDTGRATNGHMLPMNMHVGAISYLTACRSGWVLLQRLCIAKVAKGLQQLI